MAAKKNPKKQEQQIQGLWDKYERCNVCMTRMPEGENRERNRKIFETITTENSPQINDRHQTTVPGGSENTK